MEFIDLQTQYQQHSQEINESIQRVLTHGKYIGGPENAMLEEKLAEYVGVPHCILMSSGTTALQVALMALDIKPGDEIITTPFSFFATAEVIYLLQAKPIYVDINPETYLIDPALITAAITPRTRAIIPVSLYGQCADMDAIGAIAKRHNVTVIEDAAQSFGAAYKNKKSCGLSEIACTSFFPSKPLGCYGDGGACFTTDAELADRMRVIMNHGQRSRYLHIDVGINGRMDTIQSAILLEKLKFFDEEIMLRQKVAACYANALRAITKPPVVLSHNKSVFAQYTVSVENRDAVQASLQRAGIPTAVHYPVGLHEQPITRSLSSETLSFPITEQAAKKVLSLPFHPYLTQNQIELIAKKFAQAVGDYADMPALLRKCERTV